MEYKGYIEQFVYDEEIDCFKGKVTNVKDIILFHGKSIDSLQWAFKGPCGRTPKSVCSELCSFQRFCFNWISRTFVIDSA